MDVDVQLVLKSGRVSHQDRGVNVSRLLSGRFVSGNGSDREGQHRKQIMGGGSIGEVDISDGVEPRSETPAGPKRRPP